MASLKAVGDACPANGVAVTFTVAVLVGVASVGVAVAWTVAVAVSVAGAAVAVWVAVTAGLGVGELTGTLVLVGGTCVGARVAVAVGGGSVGGGWVGGGCVEGGCVGGSVSVGGGCVGGDSVGVRVGTVWRQGTCEGAAQAAGNWASSPRASNTAKGPTHQRV